MPFLVFLSFDSRIPVESSTFHVSILKDPDSDWLVVQCVEHPEAISQGKTLDECVKNIREALELVLEHKSKALQKSKFVLELPAAAVA